jgi:hypothetical protein
LDNDLGHEPFSHFSFVNPSLSHNFKTNKWSWKNSDFINITSMPSMRFYHKQLAWKVRSGIEEVSYSRPQNEKLAVSGGAGFAADINHKSFLSNFAIFFGAYNELLFSGLGIEAKKWRLGMQGDAIFAADFASGSSLTYKTVLEYRYRKNLLSSKYSDPSRIILSHGLGGQKGQILLEHGYEFTGYWQNSFKVGWYF